MIADVRFKVRMRLRAFIQTLRGEYMGSSRLVEDLIAAQGNVILAGNLKSGYRARLREAFPGCEIICTNTRIQVYLPDSYPRPTVPISEPYPAQYVPALAGILVPKPSQGGKGDVHTGHGS